MNKDKSKEKKPLNKKDKEKLRERHRRQLQQAKIQQQKEQARQQLQILKKTGVVHAYQQFLRSICKNGLPQPSNVYQFAAQFILKYERKMKQKQNKKEAILEYNEGAMKANNVKKENSVLTGARGESQSLRAGRNSKV